MGGTKFHPSPEPNALHGRDVAWLGEVVLNFGPFPTIHTKVAWNLREHENISENLPLKVSLVPPGPTGMGKVHVCLENTPFHSEMVARGIRKRSCCSDLKKGVF